MIKKNDRLYTVYIHFCPSKKRYVGITCNSVDKRWKNGKGYKNNRHFYNAIKKYGWDNIEHIIIAENLSFDEASLMEKQLIEKYNTIDNHFGYNVCFGGQDGWVGVHHTEEAKRKMSLAKKGKTYRKGYKLSEETKRKISEKHKGKYKGQPIKPKEPKAKYDENGKRIFSEEHKRKISESLKGVQRSEIVRKNMSEAQIKTKKPVRCIDTGEEFESITMAGKQYGISKTLIVRVCKGQNKTAKGLKFEYIVKERNEINV